MYSTAFVLLGVGAALSQAAIAGALRYIRGRRRPDGLWDCHPEIGVPADADGTACALAALARHGDASEVAGGAQLLRSFWRDGTGPFRTWRAEGRWSQPDRDDPVVNCNVLFALHVLGEPATPPEEAAVRDLLRRTERASRYYCAPATLAHAARRAGLSEDAVPALALARPDARDLLANMQWLCARGKADAAAVGVVLAAQRRDGSWPARPWARASGHPPPVWGSAAISTALAVEALTPL